MSDEQHNQSGSADVRRVSRKDRKKSLDTGKLTFPPDLPLPESEALPDQPAESLPPAPVVKPPPPPAMTEERYPPLYPDEAPPAPPTAASPRRRSTWRYNLATFFFVLASCGMCSYYTLIALDPYTPLNPLPPFTPVPLVITTTPLPATATPTLTPTITPTLEPTGTFTPLPAELLPTRATFTPAPFPFTISNENVQYERNLTDEGCDWVSIAGTVRGLQGEILNGYGVRIRGEGLDRTVYTGGADTLFFEPGEFELQVGDAAIVAPFTAQLLSPEGEVISEEYLVVTSDQCSQNVALINFVQNRPLE